MQIPENIVILHRAIDREKEAIAGYLRLARISRDMNAKNVLINLASDEVGHMNKLEAHLASVLQGKSWVLPKADEAEVAAPSIASMRSTSARRSPRKRSTPNSRRRDQASAAKLLVTPASPMPTAFASSA